MEATFSTCEDELEKNPELKREDLSALREWAEKQPHLPAVTDKELAMFLHSCYYRIEPAKEAIDAFFTIRTHAPELFTERVLDRPGIKTALNTMNMVFIPQGKNGYLISLYKLNDTNPRNYSFTNTIKTWCSMMESWQARYGSCPGVVCTLDMRGISMAHLVVNVTVMAKFFAYFQDALPIRIKGLVVLNASSLVDSLLSLVKPFLKKELIDMLRVCKTANDVLEEFVDRQYLPSDYGGPQKSLYEQTAGTTTEMIRVYEEYLLQQEKRLVNESKRAGKAKTESELFGVQGSFKKLDLD